MDRGVRPRTRGARPPRAAAGRDDRDLHRRRARRDARRAGSCRGARSRRLGTRRDRVGWRGVARRPASGARGRARGGDRGPRPVRRPLHARGGARVRGRLSAGLLLLRATGIAALALLLWNPVTTRSEPGGPPLVLLDASLSMAGQGGPWRAALDTARALAADGVIWRFGRAVRAFDTLPPADGASRLGPALTAAAARVGPVIVVTDGAIADLPHVPPDLVRRARPRRRARPPLFRAVVPPARGAPPDWDTRFLSRTLAEVARVPVKTFVATEPGRWRDAATLAPVSSADLARSTAAARLVVAAGDPALLPTPGLRRAAPPSLLSWPTVGGVPGDWYVEPPPPSPVAAALAGIPWDSVPPATAATGVAPGRDTSGEVALSARLARRGAPRPIVRLGVRDRGRQATLSAKGLYRWGVRGGGRGGRRRARTRRGGDVLG